MEEGSLIKSIDVKFFSPCEKEKRVGHPDTLNGKLGFGSGGGNYTTPTHINFYHFHFLTLSTFFLIFFYSMVDIESLFFERISTMYYY